MPASKPVHIADSRPNIPRNTSIDSAVSSISSNASAANFKSSAGPQAMANVQVPDFASLIQAAGSAEAALFNVWREKQSLENHNQQLWRIVTKQKDMVVGLNKDLERALKDRERYRKKLKEHLAQVPPLPNAAQRIEAPDREHSSSPALSEAQEAALSSRNNSTPDGMPDILRVLNRKVSVEQHTLASQHSHDGGSLPLSAESPPIRPNESASAEASVKDPGSSEPSPLDSTASAGESRSGANGSNGFPSPEERPQRKAPPAPLNLSQQHRPSEQLQQPAVEEHQSDSEYDEGLEVDEMPIFQRGRKKTREEDDKQRELLVQKELEERSQSKKSKSKSKSKSKKEGEQSPPEDMVKAAASTSRSPVGLGLPSSPRLAQAPGSINALLSPVSSDGSMVAQRSTPLTFASPHLARAEQYQPPPQNESEKLAVPTTGHSSSESNKGSASGSEPASPDGISRELVSDQYPNLLLPPNALPLIQVKVFSSRLQPSRHSFMVPGPSEEDPVFILAIHSRSDGKQLWRLEKAINALPALDQQLKKLCEFTGQLPDRTLFTGHAPSKIDARRAALTAYFDKMLDTPMGERAALILCEFFSIDAFGAEMEPPKSSTLAVLVEPNAPPAKATKEGYLTKRGKNFGGWKARYFVLESPEFRYFESPGGPLLGHIKLQNAQIGRQNPRNKTNQQDDEMRHAFLILEPKRKDPTTKVSHILCAESDDERDAWIDALLQYVESPEVKHQPGPAEVSREPGSARSNESGKESKQNPAAQRERKKEREKKEEKSPERYLKAKNAHREEGIFRLSGSNIVIKGLRERFNTERDIRLLEGEYYDVHAVASLLKSYLRDLPVSILTREFHLDFLKVLEMDQRSEKINAFNVLVHKLPPVNLDLLRALSSFLIDITNNSDVNKMTIRNGE
ncbi:putative rho gtpase activator protein [Neofusicoccum parvum UCRNP2]|uniref:Putative rho gtpase activator protein n=1 Tax=Botryosphaeria parva (strain UCR-NP2) TaxID=1287680 RepID=R1EN27_BOTPV|nr:putative rho gtpase activator protein [Neofusicoccum parvum UCRNP2]